MEQYAKRDIPLAGDCSQSRVLVRPTRSQHGHPHSTSRDYHRVRSQDSKALLRDPVGLFLVMKHLDSRRTRRKEALVWKNWNAKLTSWHWSQTSDSTTRSKCLVMIGNGTTAHIFLFDLLEVMKFGEKWGWTCYRAHCRQLRLPSSSWEICHGPLKCPDMEAEEKL